MGDHQMISLLLGTDLPRVRRMELMGIAIIFAILALGATLLRGRVVRVVTMAVLVLLSMVGIAIWSAHRALTP